MSRMRDRITSATLSFPRVSGDEPWDLLMRHDPVLFSPRERG